MRRGVPYRRLALLSLVVLLCFSGGVAEAQQGGVDLKIDTQLERAEKPERVHGLRDTQSAGLSIDAYGGTNDYAGVFMHLDTHFGAGYQGGFAYRLALLPIGMTVHDKAHTLTLGVSGGLQLQGVTAHQRLGVLAPIRAAVHLNLGEHVRISLWASNDFALSDRRENGSQEAFFGDEMQAGLTLRIGKGGQKDESRSQVNYGSGYFVSGLFSERLGTRFWGIAVGHGMHMNGSNTR